MTIHYYHYTYLGEDFKFPDHLKPPTFKFNLCFPLAFFDSTHLFNVSSIFEPRNRHIQFKKKHSSFHILLQVSVTKGFTRIVSQKGPITPLYYRVMFFQVPIHFRPFIGVTAAGSSEQAPCKSNWPRCRRPSRSRALPHRQRRRRWHGRILQSCRWRCPMARCLRLGEEFGCSNSDSKWVQDVC